MKTILIKLSIFFILTTIFISCSPENDEIYVENKQITEAKTSYTAIETEILDLVNAYRTNIGIGSLKKLNLISTVAETHTSYMVNVGQVNHDFFAERHEKLVNSAQAKAVGENVAFGYNTASGALNAWLSSDSHRKIIENPEYTHFGISTEHDVEGKNYFTHIFIKQ